MQSSKFNDHLINGIKDNLSELIHFQIKNKDLKNKLKVNIAMEQAESENNQKSIIFHDYLNIKIISDNLKKYNSLPNDKNIILVNNLIQCKSCHFLAIFKDFLISDYIYEFLRKNYLIKESIEKMPKIYNYYKNYLKFFCRPTFLEAFANKIIKKNGDLNAEYFYKNILIKNKNKNKEKNTDINTNEENLKYIIHNNEKNIENKDESIDKILFTKSIKNSIDNIDFDDLSLTEKNYKKEIESSVWIFGNDENDNTFLLNNNSIMSMINEIKDFKCQKNTNGKQLIKKKEIKSNNINIIKNDSNNIKKIEDKIEKKNTYMNNLQSDSLKNIIYSPKSNKKGVFFLKKSHNNNIKSDLISNKEKNNLKIDKNKINSIIVNLNININANKENINNNINIIYNKRISSKSPTQNYSKNKRILELNSNNIKTDRPLLSERNEKDKNEKIKSNYNKIIKSKNNYNNLVINTEKNIINEKMKKNRILNSLESLELLQNFNSSCNKNKDFNINKIPKSRNEEIGKDIKNIKIYNNSKKINKRNNNINKYIYFSPNKFCKTQKFFAKTKNIENNNKVNNTKFIYHKKPNNIITSPMNKNMKFKRIFS